MRLRIAALGLTAPALLLGAHIALANHSWGNYHWARTANPLPLMIGDNVSATWEPHLSQASSDWNVSSVLSTTIVPGKSKAQTCKPTAGRAEVCNAKYGSTGWLGIAQIWANGDHITQGTVKLNDTYFSTRTYNTPAWRDLVTCQEVGHVFGLAHQDENFSNPNLNTCMDYTNSPESNRHPNQHDYDLLALIYSHLDSTNSYAASFPTSITQDIDWNNPSEWGKQTDDHVYVRDFGGGRKVITDVFWVDRVHGNGHSH